MGFRNFDMPTGTHHKKIEKYLKKHQVIRGRTDEIYFESSSEKHLTMRIQDKELFMQTRKKGVELSKAHVKALRKMLKDFLRVGSFDENSRHYWKK